MWNLLRRDHTVCGREREKNYSIKCERKKKGRV